MQLLCQSDYSLRVTACMDVRAIAVFCLRECCLPADVGAYCLHICVDAGLIPCSFCQVFAVCLRQYLFVQISGLSDWGLYAALYRRVE